RIAIGVNAGRSDGNEGVASGDIGTRQQRATLGGADCEAGKVIVIAVIHARHFGGFATDERAASEAAAMGNAFDNRGALGNVEFAGGEIIEEEERLCTLNDQIIDAHGDEVLADRIMLASIDGDLELGAHAIIGSDKNGVFEPSGLEIEEAA